MKQFILSLTLVLFASITFSQDLTKFNIYSPTADAEKDLAAVAKKAKAEGKHVFVQVGGNWCIWCARFDAMVKEDKSLDSLLHNNYIVYHLNYSKENTNDKTLAKYRYPQRFGFPVFLVLDGDGKLLHTQNSSYFEQGKGYNKEVVSGFFKDWSHSALDPASYKKD